MRKKIALKLYTLIQCINDYNMGNEKVQLFFFLNKYSNIYFDCKQGRSAGCRGISREDLEAAEG